ncbi:MAG: hypothetical protein GXP37_02610 [Chloroflexi bacterium]|nr:hypothetical protein [Chloroflexota bacterium]
MIFCTVGTTDFDPLVQALDALAPGLDEPVLFQIGQGSYEPQNGRWFRFAASIAPHLNEASLIVAHGGFGTIIEVLTLGKALVSVPNPDRYDRHQEEILRHFAAQGYLIACFDLAHLPSAITQARSAVLRPYEPPHTTMHLEIQTFLQNLPRRK